MTEARKQGIISHHGLDMRTVGVLAAGVCYEWGAEGHIRLRRVLAALGG